MDFLLHFLPWLVLFLPLAASTLIVFGYLHDRKFSSQLSILAVRLSFALALITAAVYFGTGSEPLHSGHTWISVGDFEVKFALQVDALSLLMCLVVTGVGMLIHQFSQGYMAEDPAYPRFFAFLSLFMFSMLGIVFASNFVQMFIFWELVGVSSYLLIGFWFGKASAADACKKAFLTNRIGDFGFLLGILMVWGVLGTLNFSELPASMAAHPEEWAAVASIAGILVFCGAVGKSAQFPLHVWLPDAMEGPTPVSALIHAATMVAAGVYMLCRVVFLFDAQALQVIGWIGAVTSLLAALMAVQQSDIKRILAYSTLSQLGYMVMAVGCGGPDGATAAMFHLTTHALFKALLFLGAGAIIVALHHEQDIWKMGGLSDRMKGTRYWFLIGTLALCGIPPFSGYFSKDLILAVGMDANIWFFVIGAFVALLTSFYMFRLYYVVFPGQPRSEAADHAEEVGGVMLWPLRILGTGAILAGFVIPVDVWDGNYFGAHHVGGNFLNPFGPLNHNGAACVFGLAAAVIGWVVAKGLYQNATKDPLPDMIGPLATLSRRKFYFDELYAVIIRCSQGSLSWLCDWFDRWVIKGLVLLTHGSVEFTGRLLRSVQTGNTQVYAFMIVLGLAICLAIGI